MLNINANISEPFHGIQAVEEYRYRKRCFAIAINSIWAKEGRLIGSEPLHE